VSHYNLDLKSPYFQDHFFLLDLATILEPQTSYRFNQTFSRSILRGPTNDQKMSTSDFNMLQLEAPREFLQITAETGPVEESLELENPAAWL